MWMLANLEGNARFRIKTSVIEFILFFFVYLNDWLEKGTLKPHADLLYLLIALEPFGKSVGCRKSMLLLSHKTGPPFEPL